MQNAETGDWQHGYNSACLALSRLVNSIIKADDNLKMINKTIEDDDDDDNSDKMMTFDEYIQNEIDDYPSLDT